MNCVRPTNRTPTPWHQLSSVRIYEKIAVQIQQQSIHVGSFYFVHRTEKGQAGVGGERANTIALTLFAIYVYSNQRPWIVDAC